MRKNCSLILFVIVALTALSLPSCNNQENLLGLNLLPDQDKGKTLYMEYSLIKGSLFSLDTLQAYPNLNKGFIGYLDDPVFGTCESSVLFEVVPYYLNADFGEQPGTDSLILIISRDSVYGQNRIPLTFNLYSSHPGYIVYGDTLKNRYPIDSDPTGMYDPQPIAQSIVMPDDTVIRFKLGYAIANKLISLSLREDSLASADRNVFISKFGGFYMKGEPVGGVGFMQQVDLQSTNTRLELYYHNLSDTTFNTYFVTDDYSSGPAARFNFIHHNYSGTAFGSMINEPSYSLPELYIQGMAGIGVKLNIPFLEEWKNRNDSAIAFQRVELEIPVVSVNYDSLLYRPAQLSIYRKDSTGFNYLPDEPSYSGGTSLDPYMGVYEPDSLAYRYLITIYCQKYVLNRQEASDIYLLNSSSNSDVKLFERVILQNNPSHPIKLKITYSQYPKN